jgi:hypothetical protein
MAGKDDRRFDSSLRVRVSVEIRKTHAKGSKSATTTPLSSTLTTVPQQLSYYFIFFSTTSTAVGLVVEIWKFSLQPEVEKTSGRDVPGSHREPKGKYIDLDSS